MIGGGGNRHGEVEGLQKTLAPRRVRSAKKMRGSEIGRRRDLFFSTECREGGQRLEQAGGRKSIWQGQFLGVRRIRRILATRYTIHDARRISNINYQLPGSESQEGVSVSKVSREKTFSGKRLSEISGIKRQEIEEKACAPSWQGEERGRNRPLLGYLRVDSLASWAFVRTFAALRCPARWSAVAWAMSQAIAWRSL